MVRFPFLRRTRRSRSPRNRRSKLRTATAAVSRACYFGIGAGHVVVRDKKGNLITDLKKDDFTLLEDGKRQAISTFDFENVDELKTAGAAEATVSGAAPDGALLRSNEQPASLNARDRRLMLLFFDFSGMQPEDIERSVGAAKKFVQTRMQPADMIAVVSLSQICESISTSATTKRKCSAC